MFGLYQLWYNGKEKDSFHFFNDSDEWMKMDKVGHATTSYRMGYAGYHAMKWCGYGENSSILLGGLSGFVFLTSVEVFDGFSGGYGFSLPDIAANALGSGLFIGQQYLFKSQVVQLKFSFHQTHYSNYHPDLLGENLQENILKDYNGQTYWLSANLSSMLPRTQWLPAWLNIAVGYGARGMISASANPDFLNGKHVPNFNRYSCVYISPDVDFRKIHVRSGALKAFLRIISIVKVPLPTLEYNHNNGLLFRGVYF
jgi:hypothetical protein